MVFGRVFAVWKVKIMPKRYVNRAEHFFCFQEFVYQAGFSVYAESEFSNDV